MLMGFGAGRTLEINAAKPSGFAAPKTLGLAVATFRSCGCTIFVRDKARLPGVRRRGFVTAEVLTAGFLPGGLGLTLRLCAQASLSGRQHARHERQQHQIGLFHVILTRPLRERFRSRTEERPWGVPMIAGLKPFGVRKTLSAFHG